MTDNPWMTQPDADPFGPGRETNALRTCDYQDAAGHRCARVPGHDRYSPDHWYLVRMGVSGTQGREDVAQ